MHESAGSIYVRKGHWWLRYTHHGKKYRQSVARLLGISPQACTRELARKALDDTMRAIYQERWIEPALGRLSLQECFLQYAGTLAGKSVTQTQRLLDHLTAAVGTWLARDVSEAVLEKWAREAMQGGVAPATVKKRLGYVGAALRLAAERGQLGRCPRLPKIKIDNARQGFVSPAQLKEILAELRGRGPRTAVYAEAVEWAYETAWRRQEIVSLRWEDVDLHAEQVVARDTKNGDVRVLPLVAGPIHDIIVRRHRAKNGPWVFHHGGKPLPPRRLLITFQAAAREVGCDEDLVFHDLRRSAIRAMELSGVPRSIAMAVSGHKTETIYKRYAIVRADDIAAALMKRTQHPPKESSS
jgi:integrase